MSIDTKDNIGDKDEAVHVCVPNGTHDAEIKQIRSMLGECQRLWVEAADAMVEYATYVASTNGKSVEDVLHTCILDEGGAVDFHRLCEIRLRGRQKNKVSK